MKIKKISDVLNESSNIVQKDWKRMMDLVASGESGDNVAKSIKDKDKAINRFIAGLKLSGKTPKYNKELKEYTGNFSSFGNKALSLGATTDEIENVYNQVVIPEEYSTKLSGLSEKKLNNRFVGQLSKIVLDMGFDINYLPHNGYAITLVGKEAMERNGRKWTIGYKSEIVLNNETVKLNLDVVTDEGDGPSYYVVDPSSNHIFSKLYYQKIGKMGFLKTIKDILEKQK